MTTFASARVRLRVARRVDFADVDILPRHRNEAMERVRTIGDTCVNDKETYLWEQCCAEIN